MGTANSEEEELIFTNVDIFFIYSFDFGHPINPKKILEVPKTIPIYPKKDIEIDENKKKFVKYIQKLDETHISDNDGNSNNYARIIMPEKVIDDFNDLIIFSTLYDVGVGTLTVRLHLDECNIRQLITKVKLGLPNEPYHMVKKIPKKAYEKSMGDKNKGIDHIAYGYINEILETLSDKSNKKELIYNKIDCYPFISIKGFNKNIKIDDFRDKYINELWGLFHGEFVHLRKDKLKEYLKNIALWNDRIAMPCEDGTIYIFGKEAEKVFEDIKNTPNPQITNFQDYLEYRILALYLFVEYYRFEVFYLNVLSWKLSQFLDKRLHNSSMAEIVEYYYLFSKSLSFYHNFGQNLLIYSPTWNRQVWKVLKENEVLDAYVHLKEGLKIIETNVQLLNNMKNQSLLTLITIFVAFITIFSALISLINYSLESKIVIGVLSVLGGSVLVWGINEFYFKRRIKDIIKKYKT